MHGIIPLMKPKGYTSHDCVQKIRNITGIKKVGHTGTLDPNVEGVLPICIGEATKTIPFLQQLKKVYEAEITLGTSTTTEDADGEIVESSDVITEPTDEQIIKTLQSFVGQIKQKPPMYSAVKIKGRRLYEYARQNIEVERPERTVTIYDIKRINNSTNNPFSIEVVCSKGTYIRTLAVDIGRKLGYAAHMSSLIRIETDSFTIEETVTFDQIEQAMTNNRIEDVLYPIERALQHLPNLQVSKQMKHRILQGQKLKAPEEKLDEPFLMMYGKQLLAIYKYHEKNEHEIKPVRVFNMYKSEGEMK